MAVYSNVDRRHIDELCRSWREQSLLGDASFLHPEGFPNCWSEAALEELNQRFLGNPLIGTEGGGSFASKWELQLENASEAIRLLAAECLLVYYLITKSVGPQRKLEMVNKTIGDDRADLHVPQVGPVYRAMQSWIANPGSFYNTRQDIHVGFVMELALRLKRLSMPERRALLIDNPWGFSAFAEQGDHLSDTMRHVVCHLLYPEYFERIASSGHKELILHTFGDLDSSGPDASQDERLYSIRRCLKERLPRWSEARLDYYEPDLESIWRPTAVRGDGEASDPILALEYKKQIVLHGPPGTGKTFRANQLAERLIRTAALKRWGVKGYFDDAQKVDQVVEANVTRLQMHPAFGYAEFMIGLGLNENGGTEHQRGALLRLVDRMAEEREEMGEHALPHVLILDEINRTDLSAMFGEAFSAMERDKRGVAIELFAEGPAQAGGSSQGGAVSFAIPSDLYIIGTMNEIDQSVEALDFALRRRFFWFATPYEEQDLYAIWGAQWQDLASRIAWDLALPQLELLACNITGLNSRIGDTADLGPEYELGAAVFGDLPFFIHREWRNKTHGSRSGNYLWTSKGEPMLPLTSLWSLSIEPLLTQYLAGSDRRVDQLAEFKQAFLNSSR